MTIVIYNILLVKGIAVIAKCAIRSFDHVHIMLMLLCRAFEKCIHIL